MTLQQLEYFCTVCRYLSITRAAEELFVSQPAVSLAIKELEKEFNLHLFNHGKNRISLTPDGEHFYQHAREILNQSHLMHREFSSLGKSIRPIKLGIPPLISTVYFPRMIDAYHEKFDTPVQLYEYGSVRASNLVASKSLDLAMVNLDFYDTKKFESYTMMEDTLIYCVSRSHPLSKCHELTIDMLKEEQVILFNTDSVQNNTIDNLYNSYGLSPNILLYSSQLYTTLNFVRGGNCGAFLYSSLAVNPRDFIKIPIKPERKTQLGLIWSRDIVSDQVHSFINFAKEYDISRYI